MRIMVIISIFSLLIFGCQNTEYKEEPKEELEAYELQGAKVQEIALAKIEEYGFQGQLGVTEMKGHMFLDLYLTDKQRNKYDDNSYVFMFDAVVYHLLQYVEFKTLKLVAHLGNTGGSKVFTYDEGRIDRTLAVFDSHPLFYALVDYTASTFDYSGIHFLTMSILETKGVVEDEFNPSVFWTMLYQYSDYIENCNSVNFEAALSFVMTLKKAMYDYIPNKTEGGILDSESSKDFQQNLEFYIEYSKIPLIILEMDSLGINNELQGMCN